jgi:hypothetical protein
LPVSVVVVVVIVRDLTHPRIARVREKLNDGHSHSLNTATAAETQHATAMIVRRNTVTF